MNTSLQKHGRPTVGIVVPGRFIPPANGGQRVCYDLCLALAKKTRVVCFSAHSKESLCDFRLVRLFSSSIFRYFNPVLTLKLARELKHNNAYCCIVNQPFFVFSAFLACKLARCQLITYAHNLEFERSDGLRKYLKPLIFLLEFVAFNLSQRIFFISNTELVEARKRFYLAGTRCVFVPHMVRDTVRDAPLQSLRDRPFTLIFFGNFSYPPNRCGLDSLFQNIVPLLAQFVAFPCRLMIFGGHIPEFIKSKQISVNLSVDILGYVDNPIRVIEEADIMLTPVSDGAGVQTKIIEAISLGTTVLSAKSGARGIDPVVVGEKLQCVEDNDWHAFVQLIFDIKSNGLHTLATPDSFFNTYSEQAVMTKVLSAIKTD